MNLHANAALSWTGRRRLCELVVDQGVDGCRCGGSGGSQRPLRRQGGLAAIASRAWRAFVIGRRHRSASRTGQRLNGSRSS